MLWSLESYCEAVIFLNVNFIKRFAIHTSSPCWSPCSTKFNAFKSAALNYLPRIICCWSLTPSPSKPNSITSQIPNPVFLKLQWTKQIAGPHPWGGAWEFAWLIYSQVMMAWYCWSRDHIWKEPQIHCLYSVCPFHFMSNNITFWIYCSQLACPAL